MNLLYRLRESINRHIIQPILKSVAPVNEVAWGVGVGMWVGLTPTVGLQMYIVFMIWVFCKSVLRFHFDVVVGAALVWLSNPLTMVPLYYVFLVTGYFTGAWFGLSFEAITYSAFQETLISLVEHPNYNMWERMWYATKYLLVDLGFPMLFGSLFWATPGSILSFFVTRKYLELYRRKKAASMGMDYEEWKKEFEKTRE